jgi:hypothetical protein
VDIEQHLAKHASNVNYVVRRELAKNKMSQYGNPDDFDEAREALMVLMWERHERGAYDHSKGELWTYVQPAVKGTIAEALNLSRHFSDGKEDGERVIVLVIPPTDIDEEGIPSLESLEFDGVVKPINWHLRGNGEQAPSLSVEDQELAEKLLANLTAEELEVLVLQP